MLYVLKSMCSSDLHAGPCVSDLKTMADKLEAQMMLNKARCRSHRQEANRVNRD